MRAREVLIMMTDWSNIENSRLEDVHFWGAKIDFIRVSECRFKVEWKLRVSEWEIKSKMVVQGF